MAKEAINRVKRQSTGCEKPAKYSSDRRLTSRIYKEFKKIKLKRTNNPVLPKIHDKMLDVFSHQGYANHKTH
jgi:hypothetical protein